MDARINFVKQWFLRSENSIDEFEQFIFLWLCMVCIAKYWYQMNHRLDRNYESPKDDGYYIEEYFKSHRNATLIIDVCSNLTEYKKLAKRKSINNDYVIGGAQDSNELFKNLYMHFSFNTPMTTASQSKAIGMALKGIRNNLFHGGKLYDNTEDKDLLGLSTPILKALVIDSAKNHMELTL
jgi:hypothetical protein